jgi:phosphotransacetylase
MDLGGARGAGILMGASKPIVLTSRADSAQTKLASIAFAALASAR